MARPDIQKKSQTSISYWVSPDSAINTYVPTISESEDNEIRKWVNDQYWLYSDAYKEAAYRDAQQAVLDKKASVEKKAILERERKERAEKAAYLWNDMSLNQQKQIAAAENAIKDAATLIRQWQEMNWVKVDKTLTDKETVDAFLNANTEMPFGEYVNKFLDVQTWWGDKTIYTNRWLAAKLWLLWGVETAWINAWDKLRAWAKWAAQWLSNIMQNTLWTAAEWAWSNLWDLYGEMWYWAAKLLWADVSEWTVWDKMKKAKWYSWEQAKKEASSEELWKQWLLSEDMWAYNVWETVWELASEIALTAPAEALVWWAIAASKAWKIGKGALNLLNAAWWWAAFQLADDAAQWELSSWTKYAETAWLAAATAWLFNVIWKIGRGVKKWWYKLFWPKWQDQTALLTQTSESWANKTSTNMAHAADKNATKTWATELANDLENAEKATLWWRLTAWEELWNVRSFDLKYKDWVRYTTKDALEKDINKSLMEQASQKRFGNLAWKKELVPQFKFTKNWLEISNADVFNNISRDDWQKVVKLWDEVKKAYAETYGWWARVNASTTEEFLRKLDNIFGQKWWSGWPKNMINLMKEGIANATKEFEKSLSPSSLTKLQDARKAAESAISLDENINKLLWTLRNEDIIGKVWAAEKALGGKMQMEQLFKQIKQKYGIDMNNEILAWAYNMSLYDVKKAQQILETFYPSTPWLIEMFIKQITRSERKKYAEKLIEWWAEWLKALDRTPVAPWVIWWESAAALSNLWWRND